MLGGRHLDKCRKTLHRRLAAAAGGRLAAAACRPAEHLQSGAANAAHLHVE